MSALKKTSVAVMIMLVCIILAVVIGEARKGVYINPTSYENTISKKLYNMTTYGTIQRKSQEAADAYNNNDEDDDKGGIPFGKIIIVGLIVVVVVNSVGGKKKS